MKKTHIIFLILLILFSISVYAKEKVYSSWIYSDTKITLDSTTFNVFLSANSEQVIFNYAEGIETVDLGECRVFASREFCFNETVEDKDTKDDKAYIYVFNMKPTISISRTISKNNVNIGEEAVFDVTLKNTGDVRVSNVKYIDDFPAEIIISDDSTCKKVGNEIIWEGSLAKDESIKCSYTIYANDKVDTTLSATVEFYDGFENKKLYSTSLHFYTSDILTITKIIDKTTLNINEKEEYKINLTNNIDDTIENVKAKVYVPDGLIVSTSNMKKSGEYYIWDGDISKEKTKRLFFEIEGKIIGTSSIILDLEFEYNNKKITKSNIKQDIKVEEEGIELSSILTDKIKIDVNKDVHYTLNIENLNGNSYIKEIHANITSDLGRVEDAHHDKLEANDTLKLIDLNFLIPDSSSSKSYYINANVSYLTQYGDKGSEILKRTITAEPIDKITITKSFKSSEIEEEESTTVTVYVTNTLNQDLDNVFLFEKIAPGLTISGQTSAYLDISKGEKLIAYTYDIKGPSYVDEATKYTINTTAAYSVNDEETSFTESESLIVKPKNIDITITKSISDNSIFIGELVDVTYSIKNPEDETIYDIDLFFSKDQYIDVLNMPKKHIDKIDPGEIITISDEKIRPKKTGSISFGGSYVDYKDSDGRNFTHQISPLKITVSDNYVDSALIIIDKSIKTTTNTLGFEIEIQNILRNIGQKDAYVKIIDGENKWEETIKKGDSKILNYKKTFTNTGEYTLPYSTIYYTSNDIEFKSISNTEDINIVLNETSITTEYTKDINTTETDDGNIDTIYEKNLLKRFIDWVRKLFGL